MVTLEELREAMVKRDEELKRELRHNRRVAKNAGKWLDAVEKHIEAAIKNFDVVGEPDAVIEWDPENGKPYVCINVSVKERDRAMMKAYHRYIREVGDVQFLHLIVMDVHPVGGEG
jgi:hypothetical protein